MQNSQSMTSFVVDLLKEKLSPFYYYHNYKHTIYVMEKVTEIGREENCTEKEIGLLAAAALFHDAGFLISYTNHEKESCLLARRYLPDYGYSPDDVNIICGIIMATKMPQSPQNKLGAVIADADLEYLGTVAVAEKADDLFRELKHLNPALTKAQWHKTQISFLQNHRYFTRFCKKNREPVKQAYLERLLHD